MGETPKVTRRTLIGGAAAVAGGSLIRPAASVGAPVAGRRGPALSDIWVGSLAGQSPALRAPRRFALAGVEWNGARGAAVQLRARAPTGRWSAWAPASVLGHDGDGGSPGSPMFGEPVWTGAADQVQLRADRELRDVRIHLVSVDQAAARTASGPSLATPVLDAGPGHPPIIARQGWAGAQATPAHAPTYGTVDLAFVHHTVNPNGYSAGAVPGMLQSIFYYHVQVRGFWDIAYNFIVDLYGRIWEARAGGIDMAVIGAHAGAYNAQSTGIALLGDFMSSVPSRAAISALQQLLAWKLSLHGVPTQGRATVVVDPASAYYTPFRPGAHVSLPRIAGHRDGDSTDCPGNALYGQLPQIRSRATALAGTALRLTLTPPPGGAAVATAGRPATVSGRLLGLDGRPLSGAPVELQQRRRRGLSAMAVTIATATTAADGSWSARVQLASDSLLRALHRSRPAAVSDWMAVAVAPAVTATLSSSAPLRVAGSVAPGKHKVTVDLYRPGRATGKPLRSRAVAVVRGRFAATLRPPGPGSYVIVARTAADASNAAGASAPLPVTVA